MWTFFNGESQDKPVPVRSQLGYGRGHPEIGIALREVKPTKQFTVEGNTVGIVNVVVGQKSIPGFLLAADLAYQVVVAEPGIADEHDLLDKRLFSFNNFENDIHPVLRKLDQLGLDTRREPARTTVKLQNTFDIPFGRGARKYLARFQLCLGAQGFVVNPPIALEGNSVDDRILRHLHHQNIAAHVDADIGEVAGLEQALECVADASGTEDIARSHPHIGTDGIGVHALRTDDLYIADGGAALGIGNCRLQQHGGNQCPCGKRGSPFVHGNPQRQHQPTTRSKNATT